jgi:spermidine synthase
MIPRHARLILLYAIFFVSGASSLICEITWARMLVLVLGNTISATGMILAAFMGGLALGSYWSGRALSRRRTSLLVYALLEVGIGVYAVSSPYFLNPASQVFLLVATDSAALPLVHVARLVFAFAFLFAPAFLMGATFPAILAGSASVGSPLTAARTGYLYGVNTLGAALGAVAAGYLLLPRWGAHSTLAWACGLSLLAASGGLAIERLAKVKKGHHENAGGAERDPGGAERDTPESAGPPIGSRASTSGWLGDRTRIFYTGYLRITVLASTFATGFIALSYEVLMTRLVILYFGNELLVFTLIVTAFLLGIALSALGATVLGSRVAGCGPVLAAFTMAAGATVLAPPVFLIHLSQIELGWARHLQDALVVGVLLIPACLLGSLLPLAIRVLQDLLAPSASVSNAGTLYAVNTVGGMLGAGLTNAFLVPLWGIKGVLAAFAVTCAVTGVLLLWALQAPAKRLAGATAAVLLALGLMSYQPYLLEDLYARKLAAYSGQDPDPAVRLYQEGSVTTAIVLDFPWLGFRDMFLNGVEEASTRFGHVQLFKLLGLLPPVLHPSDAPQDALMIAFGAGIASGATLGSGLVSTLTCVDLNPDVEIINDLFREINGDVFHDPRFRFVADDGRNFLLKRRKQFGVIISDSTHPRAYDSWILYTEEFYRTVRKRLTPDGVFAQWVPLSDISVESFRILLNTFTMVFPNTTLWNIYGTDQAFLVATPEPFVFDLPRIQERLGKASASVRLEQYQLDKAVRLAGFFVMDPPAIARFIGDERRANTDDLPFNQKYAVLRNTPLSAQSFDRYQASISPYARGASEDDRRATEERQVLARAMHRYFFFGDEKALEEAGFIDPGDGNVRFHQDRGLKAARIALETLQRDGPRLREERDRLLSNIQRAPGEGQYHLRLAQINLKLHRIEEAEVSATTALKHSPDSIEARKVLGQVFGLKGDWPRARIMYEEALQRDHDDKAVRSALISLLAERREFGRAIELLQAMGPQNEQDFQYHLTLAGAYYATGEYGKAQNSLLRVLAMYPGSTEARFYLAEVYRKSRRPEMAIGELERLLLGNPYYEPALTLLRDLHHEEGNHAAAKDVETRLERVKSWRAQR